MIKNFFKKKIYNCAFCNSDEIILKKTNTVCDFDPNILEKNLKKKILGRQNGICLNCGISQNFELLSKKELSLFNSINKDNLTSEINFRRYPPSNQYLTEFDNIHFKKRLKKWDTFLTKEKKKVKRVLILRYWFGNIVNFLRERFDCQIDGIDMSDTCKKYVLNHVPSMNVINGEINLPSKIYIFYLNNKNEVATLLFPNKFENKINFSGKFVFPANNNYDLVANFPLKHNKDTILENIVIISTKSNKGNFKVIDKEPFISILSRLNELGRDKWRKLNLNYLILRE